MSTDTTSDSASDEPTATIGSANLPLPAEGDYTPKTKPAQDLFPGIRLTGQGTARLGSQLSPADSASIVGYRDVDLDVSLEISDIDRFDDLLPSKFSSNNANVLLRSAIEKTHTDCGIKLLDIDDWDWQLEATQREWRMFAWALANKRGNRRFPKRKRAISLLQTFIGAGITDDAARFALVAFDDEYDLETDIDRSRVLGPVVNGDDGDNQ